MWTLAARGHLGNEEGMGVVGGQAVGEQLEVTTSLCAIGEVVCVVGWCGRLVW